MRLIIFCRYIVVTKSQTNFINSFNDFSRRSLIDLSTKFTINLLSLPYSCLPYYKQLISHHLQLQVNLLPRKNIYLVHTSHEIAVLMHQHPYKGTLKVNSKKVYETIFHFIKFHGEKNRATK